MIQRKLKIGEKVTFEWRNRELTGEIAWANQEGPSYDCVYAIILDEPQLVSDFQNDPYWGMAFKVLVNLTVRTHRIRPTRLNIMS